MPAAHLHTKNFLEKWQKECIGHGIEVMKLIVEEEKDQLCTLQQSITESGIKLEPFKESPEFEKLNDTLKKEVDKTPKNLKITKQNRRNLDDWAKGYIFVLTTGGHRGRSRHRHPSQSGTEASAQSSDDIVKTIFLVRCLF